jgi:hypothetical protein
MSDAAAREILIEGARALAHIDGLDAGLQRLLEVLAEQFEVASAVVFTVDGHPDRLEIAASVGLDERTGAGLVAAVANPDHPIARTVASPVATFDVLPTAPGGPALRSHLPLIVRREQADVVVGVLALAHDRPIEPVVRPLVLAGADLAAIAIERLRS